MNCQFLRMASPYNLSVDDDMREGTEPPEPTEPPEMIIVLKRSKAGHLGEKTEICNRLDEVLKDYRFANEVKELSRRLNDQCRKGE